MLTVKNDSSIFHLNIKNYAFPLSKDDWDANWLQIEITYIDYINNINFKNSDTCLLSMEIVDLRNWLAKNMKFDQSDSSINFLEPNISFSIKDGILSIFLKYDFNPNIDYETTPRDIIGEAFVLSFNKKDLNFTEIIKSLDNFISKFPKKMDPK